MPKRIAVTREALTKAIFVWLRIMPKRIWRELEKYELAAKDKRQDPNRKPDVHGALAEHIADQFERANWEITYPEPPHPGSPPAWRGAADAPD